MSTTISPPLAPPEALRAAAQRLRDQPERFKFHEFHACGCGYLYAVLEEDVEVLPPGRGARAGQNAWRRRQHMRDAAHDERHPYNQTLVQLERLDIVGEYGLSDYLEHNGRHDPDVDDSPITAQGCARALDELADKLEQAS